MPGLTLLNIDRERNIGSEPIQEIQEIISDINSFTKNIPPSAPSPRLVPLKMKLMQLQDAVSQFGSDGSIPIETKQSAIMGLHPELQMLANKLSGYRGNYLVKIEICMNFLLNHLCSSAAADPISTVIGVSNVLAQVLSSGMQIIELPTFDVKSTSPRYFDEFALIFNSMLTTAGLFSAPVLGLPDIHISALGGWADQALTQFSVINRFVKNFFDPAVFYRIDHESNAIPFDTTTDILAFYEYENEFLAALITRADLLSGLEFKITEDDEPITLQSTEDITLLLASVIEANCNQIDLYMETIDKLYTSGYIDRNERPSDHPHLMAYRTDSKIWRNVASLAKYLVKLFEQNISKDRSHWEQMKLIISKDEELPPLDPDRNELQMQLYDILLGFETNLKKMFPSSAIDTDNFVKSSDFTKFRNFLQYIITAVAVNDIILQSEFTWTPWLFKQHGKFFMGSALKHNPLGAIEVGMISITLGTITKNRAMIDDALAILNDVKPMLDFQMHHLLAIEIVEKLVTHPYNDYKHIVDGLSSTISDFLTTYEVNPNSMLFQRSNLYLAMLAMFKESEKGEFLRKEDERFVAFDPYSWIQVPRNYKPSFPYMPLNTSIDNLNSG